MAFYLFQLFASEKHPRVNMNRKFKNHCGKYAKVLKCVEKNLGNCNKILETL